MHIRKNPLVLQPVETEHVIINAECYCFIFSTPVEFLNMISLCHQEAPKSGRNLLRKYLYKVIKNEFKIKTPDK